MSITDAIRQAYAEDYAVANELGWFIDESGLEHNGPRFLQEWTVTVDSLNLQVSGTTHLWKIRDGWLCADIGIDRYFKNHRPYKTAREGMRREAAIEKIVDSIIADIKSDEQSDV